MEITERTPVLEKYKNRGQNKRAFTIWKNPKHKRHRHLFRGRGKSG
jgi:hypothetical protein